MNYETGIRQGATIRVVKVTIVNPAQMTAPGVSATGPRVEVEGDLRTVLEAVAVAVTDELRRAIGTEGGQASAGTLAARRRAVKAYAAGAPWATRIYDRPPGRTDRMFVDSGRLIEGLVARRLPDGSWGIFPPPRRLEVAVLRAHVLDLLRQNIPEAADPGVMAKAAGVRAAAQKAAETAIGVKR